MNAADKPQPVSGPATGCGAPLVGSLQFLTLGPDPECDCCYYNTRYDVCEVCCEARATHVVHGLDPQAGQQHIDICQGCIEQLKREGKL